MLLPCTIKGQDFGLAFGDAFLASWPVAASNGALRAVRGDDRLAGVDAFEGVDHVSGGEPFGEISGDTFVERSFNERGMKNPGVDDDKVGVRVRQQDIKGTGVRFSLGKAGILHDF